MAKNYKRKNDNFLRNVLIAFGAVFVVLFGAIIYFNLTQLNYEDFERIEAYDNVADMPEDVYLVYFYSINCGACTSIKEQVLNFADENAQNLKVYLLSAELTQEIATDSRDDIVGPNGETLRSTPTLMLYENGVMTEFLVGSTVILDFLDDIQSGDYQID